MHEKPFNVAVVTHGGVSGHFNSFETREKCDEVVADMLRLKEEQPNARSVFSPLGMGSGAPLPLSAISAFIVVGPDEKLSDDMIEKAVENAKKFREALGI